MNETQDQPGLHKTISTLGQAVGLLGAILLTPLLYEATRRPLWSYLAKSWGRDVAEYLVLASAAIEAYVIYASVSLLFIITVTWGITILAMRRFRG